MLDKKFVIETKELLSKIGKNEKIQIIDIREKNSCQNPIENSEWIPASEILNNKDKIKNDIQVILYCDVGVNSFCVANILKERYNFTNIYSLKGGMNEYLK